MKDFKILIIPHIKHKKYIQKALWGGKMVFEIDADAFPLSALFILVLSDGWIQKSAMERVPDHLVIDGEVEIPEGVGLVATATLVTIDGGVGEDEDEEDEEAVAVEEGGGWGGL